jgi:hypothetical protein
MRLVTYDPGLRNFGITVHDTVKGKTVSFLVDMLGDTKYTTKTPKGPLKVKVAKYLVWIKDKLVGPVDHVTLEGQIKPIFMFIQHFIEGIYAVDGVKVDTVRKFDTIKRLNKVFKGLEIEPIVLGDWERNKKEAVKTVQPFLSDSYAVYDQDGKKIQKRLDHNVCDTLLYLLDTLYKLKLVDRGETVLLQ